MQPTRERAAVEVSVERENLGDSIEQSENIDSNGQSLGVGITAQVSVEKVNHGDTNDQTGGNTVDWNVTRVPHSRARAAQCSGKYEQFWCRIRVCRLWCPLFLLWYGRHWRCGFV